MEPSMYRAAELGDVSYLGKSEIGGAGNQVSLASFLTPQKNTVLHLAARFGQVEFADEIIKRAPKLILEANHNDDTPFHVAARSGSIALVDLLIRCCDDVELGAIWRATNSEGNTVLHEALRNKHWRVALKLLGKDSGLADCVNNAKESPLYFAAELGSVSVARRILEIKDNAHPISLLGPNGQTPLHAAAFRRRISVSRLLSTKLPSIIKQVDDYMRTALHYCASTSSARVAAVLLETDHSLAYMRDKDGLTPLLIAVISKHWRMAEVILKYCPDCGELNDLNGQNALHFAVKINRANMVNRVVGNSQLRELLNECDNDGNTPLHLATKTRLYPAVVRLLRRKGINTRAMNKEGLTALDISEKDWDLSMRKKYIWRALIRHGAIRSRKKIVKMWPLVVGHPNADLKQMANTLSVVATLLATITFAAAFTLPGGYSQDTTELGLAVFGKKAAFQVFLFSDTVAVCSSMTTVFFLVWGLIGDRQLLHSAVGWSLRLLVVALYATMIAFSTGVYLVTEKQSRWLAIIIICMCCCLPLGFCHLTRFLSMNQTWSITDYPYQIKE